MKQFFFIAGLPRSGTTLITNILKQNPTIHGEAVSSLSNLLASLNANWDTIEANREYNNIDAKKGVLKNLFESYYSHIDRPIVFDKDRAWVSQIGLMEALFEKQVKILVCVRNPAEILTSFERLRKDNPLFYSLPDQALREKTSIASRAFYYAGPDGALGISHRNILDAITMGYLDRMLFVDYSRFCNSPRSQMKRIYEFFELPHYEHDFDNIVQNEIYNDLGVGLRNLHKVKPKLEKTTVNCVQYLGLELYDQYNREIFWDAWV